MFCDCLSPKNKEELSLALRKKTERSLFLAGGTDLILRMRKEMCSPDLIINLGEVAELGKIEKREKEWIIGAGLTCTQIASSLLLPPDFFALQRAAGGIGSVQIRNKATIGGNVANASPAGDMIPALCALHAEVILINENCEERRIAIESFILGQGKTAMNPDEAITGFAIPFNPAFRIRSDFNKLGSRSQVTIARINSSLALQNNSDGQITRADLFLGAVSPKPLKISEAESIFISASNRNECKEEVYQIVQQIINENARPASRAYKSAAVRGLLYDLIDSLYDQTFPCS